jgi:hypothetical protein
MTEPLLLVGNDTNAAIARKAGAQRVVVVDLARGGEQVLTGTANQVELRREYDAEEYTIGLTLKQARLRDELAMRLGDEK